MTDHEFVMGYMHHTGDNDGILTATQHMQVYVEADGFGYNPEFTRTFYDWSHVRDSSDAGFARMKKKIIEIIHP